MQGSHESEADARQPGQVSPGPGPWKEDVARDPSGPPLSTIAIASNIPKAGTQDTWHFPSPQRFFNAMRKKGWNPEAHDVPSVVSIHNTINERCWKQVMEYESLHAQECPNPKLLKFRGRPRDFTPKARFKKFIGYALPFDRHDWVIDRCGKEVKYVLDFYQGRPSGDLPASIYLDIRPELNMAGAWDRLRMAYRRLGKKSTEEIAEASIALPAGHPPLDSPDSHFKSLPEGHPPLPTHGSAHGSPHDSPHGSQHAHNYATLPPGHPPLSK